MADDDKKPLDRYAVVAFWLAFFLMILPFEADIVFVGLRNGKFAIAALVASACSLTVLVPLLLSARRRRAQPQHWRGGGFFAAAAAILVLHFLMMSYVFYGVLSKDR